LVTGASRGIGLEVARAMVRAGAWVGMVARGHDALLRAAADVGGHAIAGDVGEPAGAHAVATYVSELLGDAPDVLVSCAGAFSLAPIAGTDPADFDRQLAVNLRGPFLLIRAFLPLMLRRRSGHLIHLGSVAGRIAFPENGAYSASKFGLRGLSEVLRYDLRRHRIGVSVVVPGGVATPLANTVEVAGVDTSGKRFQRFRHRFEKRAVTPEQAADSIVKGIVAKRYLVYNSGDIRLLFLMKRFAPHAYNLFMRVANAGMYRAMKSDS